MMWYLGSNIGTWKPGCAQAAMQAASAGWSLVMAPSAPTSVGGVLGTSAKTLVAVPCSVAMQRAGGVEDLCLPPLGSNGRVAATCCRLCKGRLVTSVSVYSWHTEGWSPRNIRLAQEVSWYLRSLRDGLWVVGGDVNVAPIDFWSHPAACDLKEKVICPKLGTYRSGVALSEYDYFVVSHGLVPIKALAEADTSSH